jgi:sec-independent protein translocase protein TatA
MNELFGFISMPNPAELIVLLVIAVLLFGHNLPEVARTWGKKYNKFRRGLKNIEDEIRSIADFSPTNADRPLIVEAKPQDDPYDRDEPTAPKFEPPPE